MVERVKNPRHEVTIAIVGKYVNLVDSYKSLSEALTHGGIANDSRVHLRYVDSEKAERDGFGHLLTGADGILVPGGFGQRGIEGMIKAIEHARVNGIPFFGICLGMQMAVVEFARNVCGLERANSTEFDENTPNPVIDLLPEQRLVMDKGASMRLGSYACHLENPSFAFDAYGEGDIEERHRHRYEFNNQFREIMVQKGLFISGLSPERHLVEIVEIKGHPWFLGCQFHPEFKSRPQRPHPLFRKFIEASLACRLKTAECDKG
jgi:CTP synthase